MENPEGKPYNRTTELPWPESTAWRFGDWYPLAIGYMARDQKEEIIEGYDIFVREDNASGDIMPVCKEGAPLNFSTALSLCEAHNGRRMLD